VLKKSGRGGGKPIPFLSKGTRWGEGGLAEAKTKQRPEPEGKEQVESYSKKG